MPFSKRLIAWLLCGLFSVHTFAGFHTNQGDFHKSHDSEKVLLLKSLVLSATPCLEPGKRILVEHAGFQNWINFPPLHKRHIIAPSFEKAVFANFNLRKVFFLSPVNLIFPFQYFW